MSDCKSQTASVGTSSVPEEFFTLRLMDAGVQTVPDEGHFPLLARLHGFDQYDLANPPDVSEVINVVELLGEPELKDRDCLSGVIASVLEIASSHGVVAEVLERIDDGARMRLRDANEVVLEGAIDISKEAALVGLPIRAILLMDGRVSLLSCAPKGLLVSLESVSNGMEDAQRVAAAVAALMQAYPNPQTTFFSLADFLEKQGDDTPWSFGRSLYKSTDCGPWVSFMVPGLPRGGVHYEEALAREPSSSWWAECVGFKIGSIVEGSDAEVQPATLLWPFTQSDLDMVVRNIDNEACALWHEANGETTDEDGDEEE